MTATIHEIKSGTVIVTDDTLLCCTPLSRRLVMEDSQGLYFICTNGKHYLDGQLQGGVYVGFSRE